MRGKSHGPRPARLFYALWPGPEHRRRLAAACAPVFAAVEGVLVPPGNLHVTLAFLGSVPGRDFANLLAIGGEGGYPACHLELARIEYWVRPKVLVALPASLPAAGGAIVDRLWRRLEPLGFAREARPWQPHLTIARRLRRPPPDGLHLAPQGASGDGWKLALVESVTHPDGPRYRPMAEWPLA